MVIIGVALKYNKLEDGRDILYLGESVRRCFQKTGALILPIVPVQDINYNSTKYNEFDELSEKEKDLIDKYLDMVDGVVFPGGFKVTPYDQYLLEKCIDRDIPTLGICLGMQLLSNYKRNFKVEEIISNINHNYKDDDTKLAHKVRINKDTLLYRILEKDEIMVNSYHRFHALENDNVVINAYSEDGYIEGVEISNKKFILGVQWHPEISYSFDENSKRIIDHFIEVCSEK